MTDRPWLLWVHFFDPHLPYVDHENRGRTPPRAEKERYRSEIAYTDGYVGRVLDELAARGFAEDTVVVFLSDHGEAFEEHPGVRRHSRSLYREELRVPLIVRVPGIAPRRVAELVRTVDLLPTLVELLDVPRHRRESAGGEMPIEGRSLVPALHGRGFESPPLLAEIRLHDGFHADAIVDGRWKLIVDRSRSVTHLFDLEADVDEQTNVADDHPDVVDELRARLRELAERAAEVGELFEGADAVELSPEELERLRELGYA